MPYSDIPRKELTAGKSGPRQALRLAEGLQRITATGSIHSCCAIRIEIRNETSRNDQSFAFLDDSSWSRCWYCCFGSSSSRTFAVGSEA